MSFDDTHEEQNRDALHRKGRFGESEALKYLEGKGYLWMASNFSCRQGEIDLIVTKDSMIVFVEVKKRLNSERGWPEEAVTPQKQKKVVQTALVFIQQKGLFDRSIRFDVVAVDNQGIRHYENAFNLDNEYYY